MRTEAASTYKGTFVIRGLAVSLTGDFRQIQHVTERAAEKKNAHVRVRAFVFSHPCIPPCVFARSCAVESSPTCRGIEPRCASLCVGASRCVRIPGSKAGVRKEYARVTCSDELTPHLCAEFTARGMDTWTHGVCECAVAGTGATVGVPRT